MSKTECPICGDKVDVGRHTHKKLHKGVIYHFCSEDCLQTFKEDPSSHSSRGPNVGAYT